MMLYICKGGGRRSGGVGVAVVVSQHDVVHHADNNNRPHNNNRQGRFMLEIECCVLGRTADQTTSGDTRAPRRRRH